MFAPWRHHATSHYLKKTRSWWNFAYVDLKSCFIHVVIIIMAPLISLQDLVFLNKFIFFLFLKMLSQVPCAVTVSPPRPSISSKVSTLHLAIREVFKIWGRGTDMHYETKYGKKQQSNVLFSQCEETSVCNSACKVLRGGQKNTDMADPNGKKIRAAPVQWEITPCTYNPVQTGLKMLIR